MSTNKPIQTDDSSTDTEPQTHLSTWGTGTNPDYEPAPTYEDPYKNTANPIHEVSVNNPLGRMYSGNIGDLVRATHLAFGKYHGDVTTDVTHEQTVYDPDTACETTEAVTEEFPARSLHYHSELVTPNRAIDAIEEMPETYNDFNRTRAIEFVNSLPPNAKIAVAREGSPALYVWHNDIPQLTDNISEHFTGKAYPNELGVVDTGENHTFPNANVGTALRDQCSGKWNLVRMWWD